MRHFVAIAAIVTAFAARADIHLVEPRDGDRLRGGSLAVLEWHSDRPLASNVEEWEAFLSVDGGRYYATRLTPHLDTDIRRFTFEVPNVATRDARLLLRFGDEHREEEVEIPARFAIEFDPAAMRMRIDGVSEREGERGVATWVEGSRDGSGLRVVAHRAASLREQRVVAVSMLEIDPGEECGTIGVDPRPDVAERVRPSHHPKIRVVPRACDRLLATQRLNL